MHRKLTGVSSSLEASTGATSSATMSARSERLATLLVLLVVLVALVPRCLTAGNFETTDEQTWMARSERFSDAIAEGDLSAASATRDALATMPGVTTMWLGSLARVVWSLGGGVGFWSTDGESFSTSAIGLHLAQFTVALTSALLIGAIVVLARRWAGPVAALTAGTLLATEPFLVAHGAVLHTDELSALFGAAGVLALLVLLDLPSRTRTPDPQPRRRRSRALAVVAGALLAGAFLTKASALALGPGLVVLIGCTTWRDVRASRRGDEVRDTVRDLSATLGVVAGAGIVTVLLLWPAMAVDPSREFNLLRESAEMGAQGHRTFFLGETTNTPGPLFYAVAMPLRMTPWMLVATVVGIPVALVARRARRRTLCTLALIAPVMVVLSMALKQFDRYAIIVLTFLAILIGIAVDAVASRLGRIGLAPRRLAIGGAAIAVAVAVYSFTVVPWGLAYFNPLLGGGASGEKALLVGWGEGLEDFGEVIAERQAGQCNEEVVIAVGPPRLGFYWTTPLSCGRPVSPSTQDEKADYLFIYVTMRQRMSADEYDALTAKGRLIYRLSVRGINYGELYTLR
jgi:hypothetical protein